MGNGPNGGHPPLILRLFFSRVDPTFTNTFFFFLFEGNHIFFSRVDPTFTNIFFSICLKGIVFSLAVWTSLSQILFFV